MEEEEEGGRVAGDSPSGSVSPRWAWVLQDALGIAFCLYMLKTVRLPTFKVEPRSDSLPQRSDAPHPLHREARLSSALCLCVSAGLHLTADGPVRLRCVLRIYYALLNQSGSTLLPACRVVVSL